MKKMMKIYFALLLFLPFTGVAQQKDTLVKKLDSLSIKSDSLNNGKNNNINPAAYNEKTKITFNSYFILLGSDFKQQLTLPFYTKRKDWIKVGAFALGTFAISFADKPIQKFALNLRSSKPVVSVSNYVTSFGGLYEIYTLSALASYGFIFKDEKIKTTVLLASQAYLIAGFIETSVKFLTGRQRPVFIEQGAYETEPVFHGPFYQFQKEKSGIKNPNGSYSSFPSGHTTVAFAAATVFAMEYRNKPLVPIIAYSAATLVGVSRLTENKHWFTDILVGATLGYLSGRQVVNNYHRYAKIKQPDKPNRKRQLSFNIQSFQGKLLPGLTYKF